MLNLSVKDKPLFRIGIVMECNPSSYTVDVTLGNSENMLGVPVLGVYGATFNRDMSWLTSLRGASVVLVFINCRYYVLSTLPSASVKQDADTVSNIHEPTFGGSEEHTYRQSAYNLNNNSRPIDFFQGDKVIRTDSGSMLGLFREGVAVLKASSLAQLIFGKYKDFGRLVSRVFHMFTDFGEIIFSHTKEGRVGMSIKGGADFVNETNPEKNKWTIQAWFGDCPAADKITRLHMIISNPDNAHHVILSSGIDGNVMLETSNDMSRSIGANDVSIINGNVVKGIGGDRTTDLSGADTLNVDGKQTITVGTAKKNADQNVKINGNREQRIASNDTIVVIKDRAVGILGDSNEYTKGNKFTGVFGNSQEVLMTNKISNVMGAVTEIVGGAKTETISGALMVTASDMMHSAPMQIDQCNVKVIMGDIVVLGNMIVMGNSVFVGGHNYHDY